MRDVTNPRIQEQVASDLHDTARLFLVCYYRIIELVSEGDGSGWNFDQKTGHLNTQMNGVSSLSPSFVGTIYVSAVMHGVTGTISIHIKDIEGNLDSQQDITVHVLRKDHTQDEYVDWVKRSNPKKGSYLAPSSITKILRNALDSTHPWYARG